MDLSEFDCSICKSACKMVCISCENKPRFCIGCARNHSKDFKDHNIRLAKEEQEKEARIREAKEQWDDVQLKIDPLYQLHNATILQIR